MDPGNPGNLVSNFQTPIPHTPTSVRYRSLEVRLINISRNYILQSNLFITVLYIITSIEHC